MTTYTVELTDEQARAIVAAFPADEEWHAEANQALQQIAATIRANPPRMEEPAWQPQVLAHTVDRRRRGFSAQPWAAGGQWVDANGRSYTWPELINPEPVS